MAFSDRQIQLVWEKATVVPNYNPNTYRKDKCDAWIERQEYGNTDSKFGWEIDHIIPESKGGTNDLSNFQPLQWENNREKADGKLVCVVTADGNINVNK